MSQADLDINRQIRRVFVRHWIDLGKLSARSINGRITIRGTLDRIHGKNEQLTSSIVESIFQELKRIRNARLSTVDLNNWTEDAGAWRTVEQQRNVIAKRPTAGPRTYDLDKNPDG